MYYSIMNIQDNILVAQSKASVSGVKRPVGSKLKTNVTMFNHLQICEELLSRCLAPDCQMGGLGCDNMTVVLVCLLQDDSPEAYQARCSRKPAENTAAGDVQNADSETYVTPEASPVRIEAATMVMVLMLR